MIRDASGISEPARPSGYPVPSKRSWLERTSRATGFSDGAEAMMRHVSTPGDPLYQQFLTPERFAAQFGPSEATVAKVVALLRNRGLDASARRLR